MDQAAGAAAGDGLWVALGAPLWPADERRGWRGQDAWGGEREAVIGSAPRF